VIGCRNCGYTIVRRLGAWVHDYSGDFFCFAPGDPLARIAEPGDGEGRAEPPMGDAA
jgi:hypothetical protein